MAARGQITIPGVESYLSFLKRDPASVSSERLIALLKRRQIRGPRCCATATAHLLINVVAEYKAKSREDLLERVKSVGHDLSHSQPKELVVGNVVRRVLGLIREAIENGSAVAASVVPNGSTQKRHVNADVEAVDTNEIATVKDDVLDGIRELLDELDQADKQIAEYAHEHIFSEETILSHTSSLTVQRFLLDAAKRRKFTLLQVEGYPQHSNSTHETILKGPRKFNCQGDDDNSRFKSLAAAGINVICVPDSAVCSLMPRVNKVVLPAQGMLSNGSFISSAGARVMARAAKLHRVPVIALGAIYRLSPAFPFNKEELIDLGDAAPIFPYEDGLAVEMIKSISPAQELISPDLVDMFVTNIGSHAPAFMYRIAADHYRSEDVDL